MQSGFGAASHDNLKSLFKKELSHPFKVINAHSPFGAWFGFRRTEVTHSALQIAGHDRVNPNGKVPDGQTIRDPDGNGFNPKATDEPVEFK